MKLVHLFEGEPELVLARLMAFAVGLALLVVLIVGSVTLG